MFNYSGSPPPKKKKKKFKFSFGRVVIMLCWSVVSLIEEFLSSNLCAPAVILKRKQKPIVYFIVYHMETSGRG